MENMKAIQTVINKAWEDDNFRQQLVSNPKAAIASATGEKVPNSLEMVVSDQTDTNTIYINIPPKPDFDNMELSDEQLEQVAGGETLAIFPITPIISIDDRIQITTDTGGGGW